MNNLIANKLTAMRFVALLMLLCLAMLISACGGEKPDAQGAAKGTAETHEGEEAGHQEGEKHAEGEEGHEEEAGGHVELTPAQIAKAGIGIAQVGPVNLRETLPLYGTIAPNAERVLDVTARFPGI